MRILFISEYYPPKIKGGGEINLSTVAKALVKSEHTVSILTANFPPLPAYEEQEGVKIYRRLRTGENPGSIKSNIARSLLFPSSVKKETKRLTSEINPDIIHFIGTSIIAAPKLKSSNKPLFATIESYPALCPKGDRWYHGKEECRVVCTFQKFISCQWDSDEIGKMKNKWYLKYNPFFLGYTYNYYKRLNRALSSCTLISISKYVQQLLLLQNLESTIIPDILETDKFSVVEKKIEKKKNISEPIRILYLGSLIKSKGPHILLEAVKGIDCRSELYGEGTLKPELQEYIQKNNLQAQIYSPVPYDQVPELYAQVDLIVFPSLWPEPFGRIAIEAQAAGKVVIGSNIGAIPELLEKGNGIVVTPGAVDELREKIREVAPNLPLEKEKKKEKSIEKYAAPQIIFQLLQKYTMKLNDKEFKKKSMN